MGILTVDRQAELLSSYDDEHARQREIHKMEVEDAVFMSQFLPRSLNQIKDYDIKKILEGDVEETYALAVSALIGDEQHKPISTNEISSANIHHSQNSYDNEDDDESMSEDESEASEKYLNKTKTLNKQERKAFLKENKKLVKEAKREKRLTKMKKKDKKQAIKKAKCKK